MTSIFQYPFGKALDPMTNKIVPVDRYVLVNENNMSVAILTRGAVVQSIRYPDKLGKMDDVCLGFDNIQDYIDHKSLYMGSVIGRMADRVSNGKFSMDCKEYMVTKNYKDKYQFNGGFNGFDNMIWRVIKRKSNGIVLQHTNPHGLEGYPGKLKTCITYTLDNCNNFRISIDAASKRKTPVNITNYLYLNLAGHNARKEGLFQHNLMLQSKKIIETDLDRIPTGSLMPVCHTPYDLRKYVNLGKRLKKFFSHPIKGFDYSYCIEGGCPGEIKFIGKVIHPCSGRWVEILSDQHSVRFCTMNDFPDIDKPGVEPIIGKEKAIYAKWGGFYFSTQNYPDYMNNCHFPQSFARRKEHYHHEVIYRFGCCD